MGKVIAITNQKGGVGKTTTTINLASNLAHEGMRTLVLDLDPQGNATSGLGVDKAGVEASTYEMLLGEASAEDCVLHLTYKNFFSSRELSLLPATVDLAGAETELTETEDKEFILDEKIRPIRESYDYILIDCPPSLSLLTVNALATADSVLIPVQCEYYALEGLAQLLETIGLVQERLNERLEVEGLVFTMYDTRANLSRQVIEDVRENLDAYIFEQPIPRNVRLAEAPSYGQPVDMYDRLSAGSKSYRKLAKELIRKNAEEEAKKRAKEIMEETEAAQEPKTEAIEAAGAEGPIVGGAESAPETSADSNDQE